MSYDVDILGIVEYNTNIISSNAKVIEMSPVLEGVYENNSLMQRRSNVWTPVTSEIYNGAVFYAEISGKVVLNVTPSSRTAIILKLVGDAIISGLGPEEIEKYAYTIFVQQDDVGGRTIKWPSGSSIIGDIDPSANSVTVVYFTKLQPYVFLVKCAAFFDSASLGTVVKEIADPEIIYPVEGMDIPSYFVFSKKDPVHFGGELTEVSSDWEVSEYPDFSSPVFSSLGDTANITSVIVSLPEASYIYARTKYHGLIDGISFSSGWSQVSANISAADPYYELVVFCVNAYSASAEGSKDIYDEAGNYEVWVYGDTNVKDHATNKPYIYFDGSGDYFTVPRTDFQFLNKLNESWTLEFFVAFDIYNTYNALMQFGPNSSSTTPHVTLLLNEAKPYGVIAGTEGSFGNDGNLSIGAVNTTNHIAYVIDAENNEWRIYVNGVLSGSVAISPRSGNPGYDLAFMSYALGNYQSKGKLFSTRLTKAARYTSDFAPHNGDPYFRRMPIAPKLLCSYNFGVDLTDLSGNGVTVNNVGMTISGGYIRGNGNNQYLNINKDIYTSGKVHTISFWFKRFVGNTHHFTFGLASRSPTSVSYYFRCHDLFNNAIRGTSIIPPTNVWTHCVMSFSLQRTSGVKKIYVNGNLEYSGQRPMIQGTYSASKTIIQVGGWTSGTASSGLGFSLFDVYEGMFDDAGVLALYNDGKDKLGI